MLVKEVFVFLLTLIEKIKLLDFFSPYLRFSPNCP